MNSIIEKPNKSNMLKASQLLHNGKLVVFPTETVYGLGADASNDLAIKKLYKAKNRPTKNPLIVHVKDLKGALSIAHFSNLELLLAKKFWPGPLTLVLNKIPSEISNKVTANLNTIAIRVPKNAIAQKLLETFGSPIAAPSANKSGEISPTLPAHALDLRKNILMILDGKDCEIGLESTILRCDKHKVHILREGAITRDKIKKCISSTFPKVELAFKSLGKDIIAPGQLLRHYSPKSPIHMNVLKPQIDNVFLAFGPIPSSCEGFSLSNTRNLEEAGRNLYNFMRLADEIVLGRTNPIKKSIAVAPIPNTGLGISINDRLARASSKKL